jgi:hypothetical protein
MPLNTQTLRNVCLFFLQLEERMKLEGRHNIARWARRRYEHYRRRLEEVRSSNVGIEAYCQRSYRPSRA